MTGMDRIPDKDKRALRRRNHIARDLRTAKFRQRRVEYKEDRIKHKKQFFADEEE